MGWQPIETAPRDGTEVLVIYEGKRLIARWAPVWHPDNKMWVVDVPLSNPSTVASIGPELDTDGNPNPWGRCGPTHWQPLPEPPRELV